MSTPLQLTQYSNCLVLSCFQAYFLGFPGLLLPPGVTLLFCSLLEVVSIGISLPFSLSFEVILNGCLLSPPCHYSCWMCLSVTEWHGPGAFLSSVRTVSSCCPLRTGTAASLAASLSSWKEPGQQRDRPWAGLSSINVFLLLKQLVLCSLLLVLFVSFFSFLPSSFHMFVLVPF